jgi:hypothetical protein
LNVVTAGAESHTRPDAVNVIALGRLFAGPARYAVRDSDRGPGGFRRPAALSS